MIAHDSTNAKVRYKLMSFVLAWSALVVLMSMFVTVPLAPVFVQSLHISTANAAWLSSIFSLFFALGCLIYGPLSDKFGRKVFLAGSLATLTIVSFISGFVHYFELLLGLRAIQGMAAAAFGPLSLVYASEMFPPDKRITVTGYITSGFLFAGIFGQILGLIVNSALGWSALFIILGIIYLMTTLLVVFCLPKDHTPGEEVMILSRYIQMKDLFKNIKLCMSFYIMFTLYLSLIGMYTILGEYLQPFGYTENSILFIRTLGIISMLTCVFAGKIANKFGVLTSLRGALALAAVSLLFMGISSSANLIILGSLLFVAGIACVVPVNVSLVVKNAGLNRGSAVLFNAFVLFLGASIGPLLGTQLIQGNNGLLAFAVLSSFLFVSLFISAFLKN